jgi:hypothetical protein
MQLGLIGVWYEKIYFSGNIYCLESDHHYLNDPKIM